MTIAANQYAEQTMGASPVTLCVGAQGGPYTTDPGNQDIVLFPSAQRNATIQSANIDNPTCKGIVVYLNVTEASGTGGLQIALYGVDPASGLPFYLQDASNSQPVKTVGQNSFIFYPAAVYEGSNYGNGILPRTFRLSVVHGDATNYTYSVGISLIR